MISINKCIIQRIKLFFTDLITYDFHTSKILPDAFSIVCLLEPFEEVWVDCVVKPNIMVARDNKGLRLVPRVEQRTEPMEDFML